MRRLAALLAFSCAVSCGLAEDERDEQNRYIRIDLPDPAFRACCIEAFDLDGDGYLSRYEAQRVLQLDCSERGIVSLSGISEFTHLESLDCSGNGIVSLDVRKCTFLSSLQCAGNGLTTLDVGGLRALTQLDCADNGLTSLNLAENVSLSRLDCACNRLATLDVSGCARSMELLSAGGNPGLSTLYKGAGQRIADLRIDGVTQVVER